MVRTEETGRSEEVGNGIYKEEEKKKGDRRRKEYRIVKKTKGGGHELRNEWKNEQ